MHAIDSGPISAALIFSGGFPPEELRVMEVVVRAIDPRGVISPIDYGAEQILASPERYRSHLWGGKIRWYASVPLVALVQRVLILRAVSRTGGS